MGAKDDNGRLHKETRALFLLGLEFLISVPTKTIMRIIFRYMGQLRQAAGISEEPVDVDAAASVATLLSRLAARHNDAFRRLLFDERDKVHASMLFFRNDEQVEADAPQSFRDGDVVTAMAPMAGGCGDFPVASRSRPRYD